MKKEGNEPTKINIIEVDEKTHEPSVVEVDADSVLIKDVTPPKEEEPSKKETKSNAFEGKQLVMTKILGYNNEEKVIDKRQRTFKKICVVVFIVFVVGVLAFTFYNDFFNNQYKFPTWGELLNIFTANWYYLVLAVFCLFLCYFFKGLKLSIMCRTVTKKWHFKTCMETAIIGHYYNNVTPLAVGGQPFEIVHLSKHGVHGGSASSLPIAAYFLNQFAFVVLALTAMILFGYNSMIDNFPDFFSGTFKILAIVGLCLCFAAPTAVIVFSLFPRFGAKMVKLIMHIGGKMRLIKNPKKTTFHTIKNVVHNAKCLKKIGSNPITIILGFIISLIEYLSLCSISYFTLKSFGFDIEARGFYEWLQIVQLALILYLAISFIPTPGNSGAADLSFYMLFDTGIKTAGLAFPAMILWRFLAFYSFIIIGFIFVSFNKKKESNLPLNE